jgi:hypothetical protein
MLDKRRGRRVGSPIRKSDLAHGEPERIVDTAYRRSAAGRSCDVWGCHGSEDTVVAAHLRVTLPGLPGAGARKPHDGLCGFLCSLHHDQIDGRVAVSPEALDDLKTLWLAGLLMQRYATWSQTLPKDPIDG